MERSTGWKTRAWALLLGLTVAPLAGCPTGDDDDSTGDDDVLTGLTIRGAIHDLEDYSTPASELTVVIADPAPMLVQGEDPTVLGAANAAADGSFEVTGIDASGATSGLIMIVDDTGDGYLSAATGIHATEYDGYTDGTVVEDQVAFAVAPDTLTRLETDLAVAGWAGGDLFASGALLGFVQQDDLTPIAGATVSTTLGAAEVYYADEPTFGSGAFDDGAGAANAATTAAGEGLWVAPDALVAPWVATADGYTFDSILVGSTAEILVIIAFRPAE